MPTQLARASALSRLDLSHNALSQPLPPLGDGLECVAPPRALHCRAPRSTSGTPALPHTTLP